MKSLLSFIFPACLVVLFACEKESDSPIIKGTVKGHVEIKDCYGYNLTDKSGVHIKISADIYSAHAETDIDGNFILENVPFGSYHLSCEKENYVEQNAYTTFGHTGGEIATTVNQQLLGIPDFGYILDSMKQNGCSLHSYVQLYDASKEMKSDYFSAILFFGDTPEVDRDNYDSYAIDYGSHPSGNEWNIDFWCCRYNYVEVFSEFTGDSVYLRVYPVPYFHNLSDKEILAQSLGKPSNVIAFKKQK